MKKNKSLIKWVLLGVLTVVFSDVLALALTVGATVLLRGAELVRMLPSF
jgi:5-bromo-4-chloroindolyl phosphate hydrolysis protein